MTHDERLAYLVDVARQKPKVGHARIVAGLWWKGSFVSVANNTFKTHPLLLKYRPHPLSISVHAELACLIQAKRVLGMGEFGNATMYIARGKYMLVEKEWEDEYRYTFQQTTLPRTGSSALDWVWGDAYPCVGCRRAILDFGISTFYYTCDDYKYGKSFSGA